MNGNRAKHFDPLFLGDFGVVLVSTNYRLDKFGFLSVRDTELTGNQVTVELYSKPTIIKFCHTPRASGIRSWLSGGLRKTLLPLVGIPIR